MKSGLEARLQSSGLFSFPIKRPVAVTMIFLSIIVFGAISYNRLATNLMPEMSYPSLTIRTEYPGAAPEEVEKIVSEPVEEALVVNRLVKATSISKAGVSDVLLEFTWDADMDTASQEVREKLDQLVLPEDVKKPLLLRYDPSLDPILRIGLYGDTDLSSIRRYADKELKRDLEGLPGVAAVKVRGGLEDEILVELGESKLAMLGLSIEEIRARVGLENINMAGGNLKDAETEYLVRTLNEFRSVEEIETVVVGRRGNVDIRLSDIGRAYRWHKDREVITRVNGRESIEINIYKEADANIVQVAGVVRDRLFGTAEQQAFVSQMDSATDNDAASQKADQPPVDQEAKEAQAREEMMRLAMAESRRRQMTNFIAMQLPLGVEFELLSDQSRYIENAVNEVKNTAIFGGILAIFILYIFLRRVASTLIIAVAIPISIVATFAPLYWSGVSLNLMSMGGLALGIGMLVDSSIVVLESIFRCREEGDDPKTAAFRGTAEVGGAVVASTLTTIAVFFPVVFVEGVAGQIFGDQALAVVFSLLAALIVALFLIPMLSSRQVDSGQFVDLRGQPSILRLFGFERFRDRMECVINRPLTMKKFVHPIAAMPMFVIDAATILLEGLVLLTAVILATMAVFAKFAFGGLIAYFCSFWRLIQAGRMAQLFAYLDSDRILPQWLSRIGRVMPASLTRSLERWHLDAPHRRLIPGFARLQTFQRLQEFNRQWRQNNKKKAGFRKGLHAVVGGAWTLLLFLVVAPIHLLATIAGRLAVAAIFVALLSLEVLLLIPSVLLFAVLTPLLKIFEVLIAVLQHIYPKIIGTSLRFAPFVLIAGFGLLAYSWTFINRLGTELIPEVHQGEFTIETAMPVGSPLEYNDRTLVDFQNQMAALPGVQKVAGVVGVEKDANATAEEGEHTSKITVRLEPSRDPIVAEAAAIGVARAELDKIPDLESFRVTLPTLFSFKSPIELEIYGYDMPVLKRVSDQVVGRLENIRHLSDVRSNLRRGNPELQIYYDRARLSALNLDINSVAQIVRTKVQGQVASRFSDSDRKIDIRVRVQEDDRSTIDDIRRLNVNPTGRIPIPLKSVAEIRLSEGPSEVRHIGKQRAASISANVVGVDLGTAIAAIEAEMQSMQLPNDVRYLVAGQNEEMEVSLLSLRNALLLAIFLVYVVMASQFESLIQPFIILFTIPMALIGVVFTLYSMGISLSVVVFIGMIVLAGIVVNNAIVLVDYINKLRARGLEKIEAIIEAGKVRLRPILMTTMTTVLGLLPMAVGLGEGAEIRVPMAITIIAGLLSSTVLTLVIIPVTYSIVVRTHKEKNAEMLTERIGKPVEGLP